MRLLVHDNEETAAESVALRLAEVIADADGEPTLGLSGGSTPIPVYERLAQLDLPWTTVHAWISDERWVPPDHERSNTGMARRSLADRVPLVLHSPKWAADLEPAEAAQRFEDDLRSLFSSKPPDVIHLGMGDDGHTASLFPGTPALEERARWYVANEAPSQPEPRLTATYPLMWRARLLLVHAVGAEKAEALARSLQGSTPTGRLMEGDAEVEWHVDAAAASRLS
jgi:6-phosphogluconolactonase